MIGYTWRFSLSGIQACIAQFQDSVAHLVIDIVN